ncbi:toxin YdaT family protein, partial [Klebsiella pneumoniae]
MENLDELKREIFNWAAESGQELVAIEISRMWFRLGGNTGAL